jgi:hypothetical protein
MGATRQMLKDASSKETARAVENWMEYKTAASLGKYNL